MHRLDQPDHRGDGLANVVDPLPSVVLRERAVQAEPVPALALYSMCVVHLSYFSYGYSVMNSEYGSIAMNFSQNSCHAGSLWFLRQRHISIRFS